MRGTSALIEASWLVRECDETACMHMQLLLWLNAGQGNDNIELKVPTATQTNT